MFLAKHSRYGRRPKLSRWIRIQAPAAEAGLHSRHMSLTHVDTCCCFGVLFYVRKGMLCLFWYDVFFSCVCMCVSCCEAYVVCCFWATIIIYLTFEMFVAVLWSRAPSGKLINRKLTVCKLFICHTWVNSHGQSRMIVQMAYLSSSSSFWKFFWSW